MHKMMAIATGGVLKEYLRELEEDPEDLIANGDEDQLPEDSAQLFFGWKKKEEGKYRLVER